MHGAGRTIKLNVRGKVKPVHTMTTLDATICLDHAQGIDPFRGLKYVEAFWDKAEELGYWNAGAVACGDCPNAEAGNPAADSCPAECGYVRGVQAEARPTIT